MLYLVFYKNEKNWKCHWSCLTELLLLLQILHPSSWIHVIFLEDFLIPFYLCYLLRHTFWDCLFTALNPQWFLVVLKYSHICEQERGALLCRGSLLPCVLGWRTSNSAAFMQGVQQRRRAESWMRVVPALAGLLPHLLGGLAWTRLTAELKLAYSGWHWNRQIFTVLQYQKWEGNIL